MSREDGAYRPLVGKRRGVLQSYSLWLGSDHVLAVRHQRFREEYRRYYFRDIRAVLVQDFRGTSVVRWWDFVVLVFALLLYMFVVSSLAGALLLGSVLLVYVLFMVRRSTCDCQVATAVSLDRWPSLHRVKRAEAAIMLLRPLLEAAQEGVSAATQEQPAGEDFRAPRPVEATQPEETHSTLAARTLYLYAAVFTMVPVDMMLGFLETDTETLALLVANLVLLLIETASGLAALMQQQRPVSIVLRGLLIGSMICLYARYMVGYFVSGVLIGLGRQSTRPTGLSGLFCARFPYAGDTMLVFTAIATGLAIAGLAWLWREHSVARVTGGA